MKIRAFIPWFTAGAACAAIAFYALTSLGAYFPPSLSPLPVAAGNSIFPSSNKKLISSLGMTPSTADIKNPMSAPLVAAMIENHVDSRPQKGLEEAVAVFELIVEGGISRFLALYRADRLPDTIEPVRSLRPHFVSIAAAFRPLLLHAGGSAIAYDALERHPEIPHHDAIRYDGETFGRDPGRNAPHNLMITRDAIKSVLDKIKIDSFDLPVFPTKRDFAAPKGLDKAKVISLSFGSPNHDVTYTYRFLSDSYTRTIYKADEQAHPKNVVVLETYVEGLGNPHIIPWTQTFGNGRMLLFADGEVWRGTWEREKGRVFRFYDPNGNVLPLEKGQVWITMVPSLDRVSWE